MSKLSGIASIVVGFEAACQMHNLREEDLPAGLRILLESLHTYVLLHRSFFFLFAT
jgi:hypothetical protein